MQSRPFGRTGVNVSVIGQGTWRISDHGPARDALERGVELGLTHIDTAELYENQSRSETLLGKILPDLDREKLFIASKVLPRNASYEGTKQACEATLERLGIDTLDLYYLHWRTDTFPLADTMRAMEELVDEGKIRFIGVSNFDVGDLDDAMAALSRHELAANQVKYNLQTRGPEKGLLDKCREHGIAFVAYSPYSGGSFPSPDSEQGKALAEVAKKHDATPHQVALNYLTRDENVFPIPKAEKVKHVESNARALDFTLDDEDVQRLHDAFPMGEHSVPSW